MVSLSVKQTRFVPTEPKFVETLGLAHIGTSEKNIGRVYAQDQSGTMLGLHVNKDRNNRLVTMSPLLFNSDQVFDYNVLTQELRINNC